MNAIPNGILGATLTMVPLRFMATAVSLNDFDVSIPLIGVFLESEDTLRR